MMLSFCKPSLTRTHISYGLAIFAKPGPGFFAFPEAVKAVVPAYEKASVTASYLG
jgi:hypothetical protein